MAAEEDDPEKVTDVAGLRTLIVDLRAACSGEASSLADVLEGALDEGNVGLGIAICDEMERWANKSKLVLQGKLKSL